MIVRGTWDWNLVKIETDAGVYGIGEAYWGPGVKDLILTQMKPLLLGEDPLNIDKLYTKVLMRSAGAGAIGGVTVTAASGIEIALFDLVGRLFDAPVANLLGGKFVGDISADFSSGTPVYSSSGNLVTIGIANVASLTHDSWGSGRITASYQGRATGCPWRRKVLPARRRSAPRPHKASCGRLRDKDLARNRRRDERLTVLAELQELLPDSSS